MTISDYYPIFYVENLEAEIQRYSKDLGFTVKHRPKIEYLDYAVLENEKKRRIDLVCSHFPADSFKEGFLGMRANVSDFDEGMSYFKEQGYSLFHATLPFHSCQCHSHVRTQNRRTNKSTL